MKKGVSALNILISATVINGLCFTCPVGQSAARCDEIFNYNVTLIPEIWTSQHVLFSLMWFCQLSNSLWSSVYHGLAYSASQLINCQLQFTRFGNCGQTARDHFSHRHTWIRAEACKHTVCDRFILFCQFSGTYIFANKILLIFYNPPRSDTNGADLPSWLGSMVFQCITHMSNHPCV